jgi:phage repressor protein C with HTH and peptisase S24 domain
VQLQEGLKVKNGAMFVVRVGQELLIKRAFIAPGEKLQLVSTNKEWPIQEVLPDADDFQIVGIPRWIGRTF